ncbi:MAG: IPT/TIG domain-containing protein, partial [Candidatus Dormibacteraeota bacterium]|nr:IPT/TIG domain-containing protein [Candidatus Dormibacteraeota bacterium]
YGDGTSSHFELTLSDWTLNGGSSSPTGGNLRVATTTYRNCDCGNRQTLETYVFYAGLPVDPSRTLTSITFPAGANTGSLHVFSIGTSATPVTGPVLLGVQPATASSGQQVTITGSGFGSTQGSGYVAFTDGGSSWGAPGDPGTVPIDSWSDGAITFTVPGSSGSLRILPGSQATATVVTSGGATSNTGVFEITPTANPADYYDNVGISPDNNQACANIDGDGYSLSATLLAADGLAPGSTVTSGGVSYVWPNVAACSADNILAAGQTMLVQGTSGAATLGLLGTSTSGSTQGTIVIGYTDGTSSSRTINFNDWAGGSGGGDTAVATMRYRNFESGTSQSLTVYVYATTVPVDSSRTVSSITFPDIGNTVAPSVKGMHIFAVGLGG